VTYLKGLVFALILANAGYLLWARGIANPTQAPLTATSSNDLKLASEAPQAALPAPLAAATEGESAAAPSASVPPAEEPSDDDAVPQRPTNPKRCVSVGPFADVAQASHAAATLRGGGYEPRSRVADGEIWAGFWVYLPVPPTAATGQQVLAKLKSAGIEDALEMPGPDDTPVISLGLFSEARRAQARVAQAQSLGFSPGITDRKRTGDVYWVDVDLKPKDSALNTANLQGEAGRIVRLETKACPAAAAP
jgi:hypothetical protein